MQTGSPLFSDIYGEVDDTGRRLLETMAIAGEGRLVERSALCDIFGENLDVALMLPLRRQIVEQDGDGYRFQVELIRHGSFIKFRSDNQ